MKRGTHKARPYRDADKALSLTALHLRNLEFDVSHFL